MEGMDTVMPGFLIATVVDTAARHNGDVTVFTDIKVIIYSLLNAGLCNNHGDVAGLAHSTVQNSDINAAFPIGTIVNLDMLCGLPTVTPAILANIECTDRFSQQVRDFLQQLAVDLSVHHRACTSLLSTGQPLSVSARIFGKISSALPR